MLEIHTPDQIPSTADPDLINLMRLRFDQLSSSVMYIVEPKDTLSTLEETTGCPILTNLFDSNTYPHPDFVPCFETLEDHGNFYEMVFILSDDDGVELFIPKVDGVDEQLLDMCAHFAAVVGLS